MGGENDMSPEVLEGFLTEWDEKLGVSNKEKFRMLLFGVLLENNFGWWNDIRYNLLPKACNAYGLGEKGKGKGTQIPEFLWSGWDKVAHDAGLVKKWQQWFGRDEQPVPWGIISLFLSEGAHLVKTCKGKGLPPSAFFEAQSEDSQDNTEEKPEQTNEPKYYNEETPLNQFHIQIVGKVPKKRKRGKQEIRYKVHFDGYGEEEDIYVDASKLRKTYPNGAQLIKEYEEREEKARMQEEYGRLEDFLSAQRAKKQSQRKGKGIAAAMATLDRDDSSESLSSQLYEGNIKNRDNEGEDFFSALDSSVNRKAKQQQQQPQKPKQDEDFFSALDSARNQQHKSKRRQERQSPQKAGTSAQPVSGRREKMATNDIVDQVMGMNSDAQLSLFMRLGYILAGQNKISPSIMSELNKIPIYGPTL